ncbi:PAP2 superfamily C-terminal-domain-containing protein [Pilobolus umbonatus]|nr:PAP2 superfamily C-terminal-domain-containing protein [Pilobolus umbonatus]
MINLYRLSRFFLSNDLTSIGAKDSPTTAAIIPREKQKIGFIKLRLAPPITIRSWTDVRDVFLNHEFLRLLFMALFLVVCGITETFMAQWSDMRYYELPVTMKYPLLDLVHQVIERYEDTQIVNYLLTACMVYTMGAFAFQSPDWTTRFIILRRWAFVMGIIYIFRGITLLVTTLPSPLVVECRPHEVELTGTFIERLFFVFKVIDGSVLVCTDNIFSGHTSMMMTCVMIWRVHSRMKRPFSWILYVMAAAGMIMIILTRYHYTVDVVLAIYITYTIWNIYLRYIQEAAMRYVFGFTNHSTIDLFNTHLDSAEALSTYEYLTWQPHPLGKKWMMWICVYVDGLDIRLRALGIWDEKGVWQKNRSSESASSNAEKMHVLQSIV